MYPRNFARVALEVLHSQVLVRKCGIPRAYKRYFATTNRNILKAYRVLNVTSESSPEEIKTAYLKKVKETHPDQNPGSFTAAEDFIKVKQAYQALQGDGFVENLRVEKSLLTQIREAQAQSDVAFGLDLLDECRSEGKRLTSVETEALCGLLSFSVEDCLDFYESVKPFINTEEESLGWNNILRRIRSERQETSETMNTLLQILDKMDKMGIEHDLALLEQQIFTFFPQN